MSLEPLDWASIEAELDQEGHAVLAGVLGGDSSGNRATELARHLYPHLAPIANRWNARLDLAHRYPTALHGRRVHSRWSRLKADAYEPLHQYGQAPTSFPLQLVALLSEPGEDFSGGEFVMTEQRPRMQSRPIVLPLRRGDLAIIAVAQRPHRGVRGDYRVNLKHAISRVRSGERLGLELLFDDPPG